jgi:hypothetical protein
LIAAHLGKAEVLKSPSAIKESLRRGNFLILDHEFFCGAWNHPCANEMNLGRDALQFSRGIVGFPELGSLDYSRSKADPSSHSILVIGYDDNVTITTKQKMLDGSIREFTYKGVYYFKNSLGTYFGKEFQLGNQKYPGFGMMAQAYAERYGQFTTINWR